MNKSTHWSLLAVCLLAVVGSVSAQGTKLYTWTDENGVVHYVDTPPDNPKAVSIDAPEAYRPGSADAYPQENADEVNAMDMPADDSAPNADSSENGAASYADQKREQMAQKREAHRQAQAQRNQRCAQARAQVATLEPSRRVFFTNDQGETERMDDVRRVRMVEEAKSQMAQYCD